MNRGAWALLLLLVVRGAKGIAAAELPVEAFFREYQYTAAQIAPDGSCVAVLAPVENRVGLAIVDLRNHTASWAFSDTTADVEWFEWATSGRLVFGLGIDGHVSPGLLAVNKDGSQSITLVPVGDRQTRLLSLLPNSADEVLVSSLLGGTQTSDSLLVYGSVWRMNTFTGKMTLEVKNPGKVFAWLADYEGVIRVGVARQGNRFKVLYRDDKNSPWRVLSEFNWNEAGFSPECFARDNRNLLVRAAGDGDTEGLYVFNVSAGKLGELAFRHAEADLGRVLVSAEKRDAIGVLCEAERPEVYWFNPQLKALQASVDKVLTNTVNRLINTTRDWSKAVFLASSDRDPGSYYLVDTSSAHIQKLSDVAEWIHPDEMAEMKPIEFTARDGLKIHGYLTLPAGCSGRNLPLIVNPHGGPMLRNTWGFDREVQFLASRGYAVLRVNFRGSAGYGKAFLEAGFRQWGLKQQDDITDGVKWATAQGIADPKRIAIFGVSYGGFAALTGLEKTPELYRCGISYAGVIDVLRAVDPTAPTLMMVKSFLAETIGDPRKDKAVLKENSPLKHVDQIRVPVFLAYGKLDPKVPIATARTLAAQLKKQGKLYDFMVKEDEGHGFFKESNRIEFWRKVDAFLKANLN